MSRSGYTDDCDDLWAHIRWRGAVTSAIRGQRGQAFLRELLAELDAMPEKRLIEDALVENDQVCAIGSVGRARGIDMTHLDPDCPGSIAKAFGISRALVCEIEFMNDDAHWNITPEERWHKVRAWVASEITNEEST